MRLVARTAAWCAATAAVVFAVSWALIDPHLEMAEDYPCGTLLRDDSGRLLRVTLGKGDVDCRPSYAANRDD